VVSFGLPAHLLEILRTVCYSVRHRGSPFSWRSPRLPYPVRFAKPRSLCAAAMLHSLFRLSPTGKCLPRFIAFLIVELPSRIHDNGNTGAAPQCGARFPCLAGVCGIRPRFFARQSFGPHPHGVQCLDLRGVPRSPHARNFL
jgi:hypothetical protein